MARRVSRRREERAATPPSFCCINPSILHHITYCSDTWKGNPGGRAPPGLVAVFFFSFFFFNVLSGDYNIALADIYIYLYISWCFFGSTSLYHPIVAFICLYFFFFLVARVERTGPIRYPIHCLSLLSGNPSTLCDPPCTHAYHSLFVLAIVSAAPSLYANVTPFAPLPGK